MPVKPKPEKDRVFILLNKMREEYNKALGVGYLVEEDKLYVMTSIKKIRVGQDLLGEEVRVKTPDTLTRRRLLSQVADLYDSMTLYD